MWGAYSEAATIKKRVFYAVALHDFVAGRPDELAVKAGYPVTVVAQSNREWFLANPFGHPGKSGFIPVSFLEVRDPVTDKPIPDIGALMDNGMLPHVEDWKKQMLNSKANSTALGILDDSIQTPSASHLFTSANTNPQNAHPPAAVQIASTQPYDEQRFIRSASNPIYPS